MKNRVIAVAYKDGCQMQLTSWNSVRLYRNHGWTVILVQR